LAVRQIFEAGDEKRWVLAVDHGDRTRLALVPVFLGDDRAVAAGVVELDRHLVLAVHLHAVDRRVDPAAVGSRMMTIEPEPMNGPPSLRCQWGAGSLPRSTLRPRMEFSMNGAFATSTGCAVRASAASASRP
jgi:hypothetical protein